MQLPAIGLLLLDNAVEKFARLKLPSWSLKEGHGDHAFEIKCGGGLEGLVATRQDNRKPILDALKLLHTKPHLATSSPPSLPEWHPFLGTNGNYP